MKLLILNDTILAAGDLTETADSIQSADAIYPKHVIPGWQIVEAEVPEGFTPAGYTWDGGQVVVKLPVVVPRNIPAEITTLEATVTPRRIREAIRGSGKAWLDNLDDQIAALRTQL